MKLTPKCALILLNIGFITLFSCTNQKENTKEVVSENDPESNQSDARLEWFKEAKFGMFIHWGLYAVPAGEWNGETNHAEWIMLQSNIPVDQYEGFAKKFNPVEFNAEQWVKIAKQAGMKYIVITSKHHDGFSMYNSQYTDYDIVDATPFKRDPLKELAEACQKEGLKFCVYYSIVDWHHPDFPSKYGQISKEFPSGYHGRPNPQADISKYNTYMNHQIKELLTNYGPIGIVWFDGGGSFRNYDRASILNADELVKMIHETQPATLINNRLGVGADYGTPEQYIPESSMGTAFEVCMTLNDHWGYNKYDHNWKDAKTIINNLSDIASKGGNYLLNVGPTAQGVFPQEAVDILRQVGDWMKVNHEAIYDVEPAPPGDKIRIRGRITQKPGKLYLHVSHWPDDQQLFVQGMKGAITKKIYLLADPQQKPLKFDAYERSVNIHVPDMAPDAACSIIVLEYDGKLID